MVARYARLLSLPTIAATIYLARVDGWYGLGGGAVLVVLLGLFMRGEIQRCPRCEASLTTRRWWGQSFAPTCPECGCPID
jgi:hypothetical protein